jgi:hypothetical protein
MMLVQEKDYVVVKTSNSDTISLARVNNIAGNVLHCNLMKDSHIIGLRKEIEVPRKHVVAVIDPDDPRPGRVFGCDTSEIYRGKKSHPEVGPLYFFYKPAPEVGEKIVKAFDKSVKILANAGLDFIIDPSKAVWEIHPFNGEKYCGMYKRSRKPEKNPHRFIIKPEMMPATEWTYVVMHEYAHHLHSEFVTSRKLNGSWVKLYNTSILVKDVDAKQCRRILDNLLAQEAQPSDFKGQLDEGDALAFKWILKVIRTQHKLSIKELDTLFAAEFFDDIQDVWPEKVTMNDLNPLVTEYATKNYRELFAESFAYYMTGKSLPKAVTALLEKSISYAKSNSEPT